MQDCQVKKATATKPQPKYFEMLKRVYLEEKRDELLHRAVAEDNEDAVKFLLKHGANPNARKCSTKEAMCGLERTGNQQLHDTFARCRAASTSSRKRSSTPSSPLTIHKNFFTEKDFFPLPIEASMMYSFNPRDRCNSERPKKSPEKLPTALHVAISVSRVDIITLLLGYGAEPNLDMEGDYTPLMIAVLLRRYDVAEVLLCNGAEVNARSKYGKTAIHFAIKNKEVDMVQLLVRNLADVNAPTDHGVTPLHVAVEHRLPEIAELLLKNGCNVNAQTKTGITPLHCAVAKGQRDLTEMMLSYGADVHSIMKKGEIDVTPLLWVTENDCKKTMDILNKYTKKAKKTGIYGHFFKKIWKHVTGIRC